MSRKGRGAEIDRSGWPGSGPMREWLEYCDRLHKANNFRSLRTLAAAMGYSSPSWVSQLLRGPKLPYDDTQAQSLVKALGAEGSEVDHALKLYRRALPDGRQRHVAERRDCVGRLISELGDGDAVAFGVHPSVQASTDPSVGNAPLPGYLPRRHDKALRADIARAEHGSRVVVLVGQSSTGKSRACWEAMRSMLPDWFVWHPLAPTRPTAVLEALEGNRLRPRTVIWLDEMQLFLAAPTVGEQVATRLHELVQDQSRGPLLVLGSMWPRYIDQISREPAWDHAAARLLLRIARIINVPQDFTGWDLTALRERLRAEPDAILRLAVARAGTRVCQFLAGVPHLMARYEQADATTQAVVWAAMDARRLGHGRLIPEDFLRRAARSYLTADTWEQADADWFQHALSTLAEPCLGVPGPLVAASDGSGLAPTTGSPTTSINSAGSSAPTNTRESASGTPPSASRTRLIWRGSRSPLGLAVACNGLNGYSGQLPTSVDGTCSWSWPQRCSGGRAAKTSASPNGCTRWRPIMASLTHSPTWPTWPWRPSGPKKRRCCTARPRSGQRPRAGAPRG